MVNARVVMIGWTALVLAGCSGMEKGAPGEAGAEAAKFPPEGVDHLLMTVDLEVEIFGIGKDSLRLEGSAVVHRGGGQGAGGERMAGDLIAASLRGGSKVFGRVVAIESPVQRSPCEYVWKGPKEYRGRFDINGWFFLPRHDLIVFTRKPVRVEGPADRIPPVGHAAEGTDLPVDLYDFRKPGSPPIGSLTRARGKIEAPVGIEEALKMKDETVEELKSRE